VRHGIAKRETEWRADKALRKRHCKHCAGRKNDCGCEEGCDKPEAAKCVDVIPKKQQKTED